MQITLYQYRGLTNKLDKSTLLTNSSKVTYTNCYLKEGSNISNPIITLKQNSTLNLSLVTYAYIPSFNRYYFVEVDSITNELWNLKLNVDVLNTYSSSILTSKCVMLRISDEVTDRIEDNYNELLNDEYSTITTINNDSSTNYKNKTFNISDSNSKNIVMSVINNSARLLTSNANVSSLSILPAINRFNIMDNAFNYKYIFDSNTLATIQSLTNLSVISESSNIKSIIVYPYSFDVISTGGSPSLVNIWLGSTEITNAQAYLPTDASYIDGYICPYEFTINISDEYTNREPYSSYQLYIAFVGWVDIAYSDFNGYKLIVVYKCNTSTGESSYWLINTNKGYIIKSGECQLGIKVGLSRDNQQENIDASVSNAISTAISSLGSIASIGFGVASGNPIAVTGGVLGLTSSISKGVASQVTLHSKAVEKANTSFQAIFSPQNIYLKKTTKSLKYNSSDYQDIVGLSTSVIDEIQNINGGFIQVKDVKLSDMNATEFEREKIISLLKSGIYK